MRFTPSKTLVVLCTLLAAACPGPSFAEDAKDEKQPVKNDYKSLEFQKKKFDRLETIHGRKFYDCEIIHHDPHGVVFRHHDGIAKLPFDEFQDSFQSDFSYKRDDALEFLRHFQPKPSSDNLRRFNRNNRLRLSVVPPIGSGNLYDPFQRFPRSGFTAAGSIFQQPRSLNLAGSIYAGGARPVTPAIGLGKVVPPIGVGRISKTHGVPGIGSGIKK